MKLCPVCHATYSENEVRCPEDGADLIFESQGYVKTIAATDVPSLPSIAPSTVLDPLLGQVIDGKFKLEGVLGRGGMGAVYRAKHLLLERIDAVKVLRSDFIGTQQAADRFLREARTAARIKHPNIITIYDFGVLGDGSAYLDMEFLHGQTLRDLLRSRGALPLNMAFPIIRDVCAAVEAAHKKDVIHRDLKPENIFLEECDRNGWIVKVLDFGLAKLIEASDSIANITGTGEILGTPAYMSPEHCDGMDLDSRSDIYSLGVIFYEMLVGHPPFRGRIVSILSAHLQRKPEPPHEVNPSVPFEVGQAILKALEKEKSSRPATVGEFFDLLDYAHVLTRSRGTHRFMHEEEASPEPVKAPDALSFETTPIKKADTPAAGRSATLGKDDGPTGRSTPIKKKREDATTGRSVPLHPDDDPRMYETLARTEVISGLPAPVTATESGRVPRPTEAMGAAAGTAVIVNTDQPRETALQSVPVAVAATPVAPKWRTYVMVGAVTMALGGAALGGWAWMNPVTPHATASPEPPKPNPQPGNPVDPVAEPVTPTPETGAQNPQGLTGNSNPPKSSGHSPSHSNSGTPSVPTNPAPDPSGGPPVTPPSNTETPVKPDPNPPAPPQPKPPPANPETAKKDDKKDEKKDENAFKKGIKKIGGLFGIGKGDKKDDKKGNDKNKKNKR